MIDSAAAPASRRTPVIAGAVGSIVEWYDFAVYGFFAASIGKLFFPSDVPVASLLSAFAVFAVGYAARPVGSLLFGYLGDRFGRRRALMISIVAMGASTTAVAILPTYAQIGVAAPVILIALRILQGLSVGGEYTGASVYVAEHAPPKRRGFLASFVEFGVVGGFMLGSAIGAMTAAALGDAGVAAWGWRIPFAFGGVLTLIVLALRRNMPESFAGSTAEDLSVSPLMEVFRDHWREMLHITALVAYAGPMFYIVWVYAASYLEQTLHFSTVVTMDIYLVSLGVIGVTVPIFGHLSDRFGRRPFFLAAGVAGVVLTWPLFYLLHQPSVIQVLIAQCGFAILLGAVYGMVPATIAELLPTRVRCSGAAIGYNACLGLIAGTAPLLSTWLVARTGDVLAPAWYLILLAGVHLIGWAFLKEKAGQPLS